MIDFRYHLVSLISVFLALAVGIVLGAGPLKERLGDTLTEQVSQLREEKDTLRGQVDDSNQQIDDLGQYVETTAPQLLDSTLAGDSVAIVTNDASLGDTSDTVKDYVQQAGGDAALTVKIDPSLYDEASDGQRTDLLGSLAAILPSVNADEKGAAGIGQYLAAALTDPDLTTPERADALDALNSSGFVSVDGNIEGRVDGVIMLTADPQVFVVDSDTGSEASARLASRTASHAALAERVVADGSGMVVAGVTPDASDPAGVLTVIRADQAASGVSTVDGLPRADTLVVTVLALAEQEQGRSGSYGTADNAGSRMPDIDALRAGLASSEPSTDDADDASDSSSGDGE